MDITMDVTSVRRVASQVEDDATADAMALDGKPFNGRTVAETFGVTLAMIVALAKCVDALAAKIEADNV